MSKKRQQPQRKATAPNPAGEKGRRVINPAAKKSLSNGQGTLNLTSCFGVLVHHAKFPFPSCLKPLLPPAAPAAISKGCHGLSDASFPTAHLTLGKAGGAASPTPPHGHQEQRTLDGTPQELEAGVQAGDLALQRGVFSQGARQHFAQPE